MSNIHIPIQQYISSQKFRLAPEWAYDENLFISYAFTNGLKIPTVVKLELILDVGGIKQFKENHLSYSLDVFASSNIQQSSRLNCVIPVEINTKGTRHKICIAIEKNGTTFKIPENLHFWLYCISNNSLQLDNGMNRDGSPLFKCQRIMACGFIPIQSLIRQMDSKNSFTLTDPDNRPYIDFNANLIIPEEIRSLIDFNSITPSSNPSSRQSKCDQIILQTQRITHKYKANERQRFLYIERSWGKLPILSFPVIATQTTASSEFEPLAKSMIRIAYSMAVSNRTEHILNELLTLQCRALLFELDQIPGHKDRPYPNIITDFWFRPNCIPNIGLSVYDCDDGSAWVLETFHLFQKLKYNEATEQEQLALNTLQSVMRKYTPFLALGDLKIGNNDDELGSHAFVILLDRRYVEQLRNNDFKEDGIEYAPIIILESTNWTDGVWFRNIDSKEWKESLDYKNYQSTKNLVNSMAQRTGWNLKWDYLFKFRMSQGDVQNEKLYGKVTALVTGCHYNNNNNTEAFHLILHQNGKCGVDIKELANHSKNAKSEMVYGFRNDQQEMNEFRQNCLSEMAPSSLYTMRNSDRKKFMNTAPKYSSKNRIQLAMRTQDFKLMETVIESSINDWSKSSYRGEQVQVKKQDQLQSFDSKGEILDSDTEHQGVHSTHFPLIQFDNSSHLSFTLISIPISNSN